MILRFSVTRRTPPQNSVTLDSSQCPYSAASVSACRTADRLVPRGKRISRNSYSTIVTDSIGRAAADLCTTRTEGRRFALPSAP